MYFKTRQKPEKDKNFAFGCSHTYGIGVKMHEAWPYLLGLINLGIPGSSSDELLRLAKEVIPIYRPKIIYVLWPDWWRFEINNNGIYEQILPMHKDRIKYMDSHPDHWCLENFNNNVKIMSSLCLDNQVEIKQMTLFDLIPFIDHADKWPVSKLGHHNSEVWHGWVADIFMNNKDFPMALE